MPGSPDDGARMNRAVDYGRPIDPNRNFDTALPGYARRILADLKPGMPIIALHTNARGFDTGESRCNQSDPPGSGVISIRYLRRHPAPQPFARPRLAVRRRRHRRLRHLPQPATAPPPPSAATRWSPPTSTSSRSASWKAIGSLSNYAVLHDLDYLNFETLDRGDSADGLAEGRRRLVHIIDRALAMCGPG
jgi:hypothetical protein